MIKRKPDTNLISHSKTFTLDLFNPTSCCKLEQSPDEKSFFYICSFFGWSSGVTGTSDKFCSQDAARWIVAGLEILMRLAILKWRECWHCDDEWLQPPHIFVKQFAQIFLFSEIILLLVDHVFFDFSLKPEENLIYLA